MGLMDKLADEATKTGGKVYVNPYTGSSIKYNSSKITDIVPTVSKKKKKTSSSSNHNTTTSSAVNSYDAQAAAAEELRRRQEEIAQRSYDRNVSALQNAYAQRADLLKKNYDSTIGALNSSYGNSRNNVNAQSDKALREAYVNRMMSQRNLGQSMAAQGMSGGLSETTQAGLLNNYGNARNNIEDTRSGNLKDLEVTYNNNVAAANQQYNNQLAEDAAQKAAYMMQLENDLSDGIAKSYSDMYSYIPALSQAYTQKMSDLLSKQQSYTPTTAEANNTPVTASTTQGSSGVNPNYYANYAAALKRRGYSDDQIVTLLTNTGLTEAESIQKILNQLS